MEHDAFRYDFTIRELFVFLFKRPKCRKCGVVMERKKEFEIVPGSVFMSRSNKPPFHPNSRVKHYFYTYKCPSCGASQTLAEIAKKR